MEVKIIREDRRQCSHKPSRIRSLFVITDKDNPKSRKSEHPLEARTPGAVTEYDNLFSTQLPGNSEPREAAHEMFFKGQAYYQHQDTMQKLDDDEEWTTNSKKGENEEPYRRCICETRSATGL